MKQILRFIVLCFFCLQCIALVNAQQPSTTDSTSKINQDSVKVSIPKKEKKLESKVHYTARDSMRFDIEQQKVYLYGNATIVYGEIDLKADYVELDFKNNLVHGTYTKDSLGHEIGIPVFTEGNESFKAKVLTYNFETKKGLIKEIYTEQGGGYMQGSLVKKLPDNTTLIKKGLFTTCELDHPHFQIQFYKAKVIPNDKIITGSAFLVIEDIPTVFLPFGFFPNKKGQSNGILMPMPEQSANLGLGLRNGGYYIGYKNIADIAIRTDLYTRGSWRLNTASSYNKRYKYNGNLLVNYAYIKIGEKGLADYELNKSFNIKWRHTQDPKARPNSRFSADVNAGSSSFDKFNSYNPNNYMSNQMNSSISYSTILFDKWNFSANMRHSQNKANQSINLTLPEIALSANRFYPFRNKSATGARKWYEDISVSYMMNARNQINTTDSLFNIPTIFDTMSNGMKHTVQTNTSFKVLKYFSLTPSVTYNEYWYLQSTYKNAALKNERHDGFANAREIYTTTSLTTKVYGMVKFRNFPIQAFRHVVTPSASLTLRPDLAKNIQRSVRDNNNRITNYTILDGGIMGRPNVGKSGLAQFSVSNNLEMKVRNRKDTANAFKKIVLIENFTISTGYDLAKDSLKWQNIDVNGRTKLFKKLDITYRSTWDPYITDSLDHNLNITEWEANHRLARLKATSWSFGLNWDLTPEKFKRKKPYQSETANPQELKDINQNPDNYVDFNIPWRLNISYTMFFSTNHFYHRSKYDSQKTLSFNGDISISKKWKIGFTSGYDFKAKDFSYTSIDIYRDLHCWEMRMNWIPFGFHKSYLFTINVKSSVLQDLKLTKRRSWYDN